MVVTTDAVTQAKVQQSLGTAVIRVWADLSQDIQGHAERDESLRKGLAKHPRHGRTQVASAR
jgi:hypothetical protein